MARNCVKAIFFFFIIFISISALLTGCTGEPAKRFNANELQKYPASVSGRTSSPSPKIAQSPESFVLDPNRLQPGQFWEVLVNNFIVILDASGSKYLPYSGKVKLKVAKDIVRRLNQKTPERPLVGGLRRYGYEAGAWSVRTALLYGMGFYNRPEYANAIDIVRWAGGKSPLELAIDKASDDFQSCDGYLALVVVSDGKVYDSDPIEAARRIKKRYGDRICIYTCLIGNLPYGQDLMERVAKVGECGYAITADQLVPENVMGDWAYDIFHRTTRAKPATPRESPPTVVKRGPNPCELLNEALRMKVQFDLNKWQIRPEYFNGLNRIAQLMIECPVARVEIQGHTCNIWTEKYNLKLSDMRATEVMNYLVKRGVESHRFLVRGFGLTMPAASNKTDQGREANRRAEFVRID